MQDKMNRQYFLLIVPGMVIFTIGVILPLLLALRYSFTSWDGMTVEKEFVGISNYINLWKDANFRQAWWFTIKFTIANTIVQNVFAQYIYLFIIVSFLFSWACSFNNTSVKFLVVTDYAFRVPPDLP